MKDAESKLNKEFNSVNKKVILAERNIQNKMKLMSTQKTNELKSS